MDSTQKTFHKRGFISLLTGFSFFVMLITGIVLYFVPQGRIAYWIDWRFLWLSKTDWGNIHITSSVLFATCACYHLVLNWRTFYSYLVNKLNKALSLKKEQALATAIAAFFVFGSIYYIPPLSYIIEFNDYLKNLWVSKDTEPPFGHAEQLSLKSLAKRTNIDLQKALAELQAQGIKIESETQSLSDVAKKNKTSPMNIFIIMSKHKDTPSEVTTTLPSSSLTASQAPSAKPSQKASNPDSTKKGYSPEMIEELLAGKGIGKKTIAELSAEMKVTDAVERLKSHGIEANSNDTFKDIAAKYNTTPIEIAKKAFADK